MRRGVAAVTLVALALVQATWAPRLEIAGAFPNLVLLAVVGITWRSGLHAGLAAACTGGLALDLTSSGAVGPHVLALLVGVYATGFWIRNLDTVNALHAALSTAVATLVYSVVLIGAGLATRVAAGSAGVDAQLALAAAAYNAMLAPLAVEAVRRLGAAEEAPAAQ